MVFQRGGHHTVCSDHEVFDQLGRAVFLLWGKTHDFSMSDDGLSFKGIDIQRATLVTASAQTLSQFILHL